MPNKLIHETSPYLLQHAHNPVDWYPWGEEAFALAMEHDKPVLVSIGYSACHWCHVMERESFEDAQVAALMNELFVNIKVDREERPDVDQVYMEAVQAISGQGGWPLNVFLTPDRQPFYGGTYFPPQRAFNRSSWTEVLQAVSTAFREQRQEINQQAAGLMDHISKMGNYGRAEGELSTGSMPQAIGQIMSQADRVWGGFGNAPKFPQTMTISLLLDYALITGNEDARTQAILSLDKMYQGGLYDHLGGGFARYSTDKEWLVPHFEKMLYDNGLLMGVYAQAFKMTGAAHYLKLMDETSEFITRELMHPSGGCYSALDADSEGVEGKFYVWSKAEVEEVLGEDAEYFSQFYDITEGGNWEHTNILNLPQIPSEEDEKKLKAMRARLLRRRDRRVRPGLDDKILLSWNALMNRGWSLTFAATGNERYLELAEKNMSFMLNSFRDPQGRLKHSWKDGVARHPAFLDDYAGLISALIELAQVNGELELFDLASGLMEEAISLYGDEQGLFFYYTAADQRDVPVRKKDLYDAAQPGGNSMMARNLQALGIMYDREAWRVRSLDMVKSVENIVTKYPTSFSNWLSAYYEQVEGIREIVILGKDFKNWLGNINRIPISHKLAIASKQSFDKYPLLRFKHEASNKILIYFCKNYACQAPVSNMQDFLSLL